MEEIEFSRWLFEDRLRQGKNVLPDGLNWLCYFAGSSKSHRENSISCIFLESPHQVDMKNVFKCYKHFFCYSNSLKTHCAMFTVPQYFICHQLLQKMKIPPKLVGISTSIPEPPVTNVHQIKILYGQYTSPQLESKRIGGIHGHSDQKLSGNSAVIKKIISSAQTFSDPVRRDHSLILTP